MHRVLAVAQFTVLEEVRSRILNATALFGGILVYFGLVISRLAGGFEDRFFRDVSFACLELFGLAVALQSAYRIVQQDMKKGSSVEMFFVRPIKRAEYLLGRFLGVASVLAVGLAILGAAIFILMAVKKFEVHALYAVVLAEVYFKLVVMLAVAFLMASVTTSQASYFVSSLLFYLSGHVVHLLRGLVEMPGQEQGLLVTLLVKPLVYLLPNFSVFGILGSVDAILAGVAAFGFHDLAAAFLYALVYSGCAWGLSAFLFTKREVFPN